MPQAEPTYCNKADMIERYREGRLAEITGDPDSEVIDDTELNAAITDFASRMNVHLRRRYPDLPFTRDDLYLRSLNCRGSYFTLKQQLPEGLTEDERKEWVKVLAELADISSGKITIDSEDAASPGSFSANPRLFGRARRYPDAPIGRLP